MQTPSDINRVFHVNVGVYTPGSIPALSYPPGGAYTPGAIPALSYPEPVAPARAIQASDHSAGVIAPGHAGQGRVLHRPFDVLHIAGADRAGRDLDDRCCGIDRGIRQLEQA